MKEFISRPYWNVIVFSLVVAFFFTGTVAVTFNDFAVSAAGVDAISQYLIHGVLFALSVLLASGFVSVAVVFAKRQMWGTGWGTKLNANALALLISAGMVLASGLAAGLRFYLGAPPAELNEFSELVNAIQSALTLISILSAIGGAVVALIAAFAARSPEEEDDPFVDVPVQPPAAA